MFYCLKLFYRRVEAVPRLLALCRERGIAVADLAHLPGKRQGEVAAERLLLAEAFGRPVELAHTAGGAPVVSGSGVNISISHTPGLVALACDSRRTIGVDAEQADRRQVLRVRDKYLNDSEKSFIAPNDLAAHIIAWTIKEAVIKAEQNSALDWTNGITVQPFTLPDPFPDELTLAAACNGRDYHVATRLALGHYITLAYPAQG